MIYDPQDLDQAMDEHGVLFYRRAALTGQQGAPEWVPLQEHSKPRDFYRPEW
jgi:hypothetical protein